MAPTFTTKPKVMDIDRLIRKAVTELRLRWGLPKSGFIAGGAISNLVWEYVSGNKARVNDIDVFSVGQPSGGQHLYEHKTSSISYCRSYRHITEVVSTRSRYKILSVSREGMLNHVSHTECCPATVLESFDINATCVGYSLDESRPYHLPAFGEFLRTGQLRISRLNTPAHTALRLAKKARDLSVALDPFELDIVDFVLRQDIAYADRDRVRFKDKYARMYHDNADVLAGRFRMERCPEIELFLSNEVGSQDSVYRLVPVGEPPLSAEAVLRLHKKSHKLLSQDILFYFRGVHGNPGLTGVWSDLMPLFKSQGYADPSDPLLQEKAAAVAAVVRRAPECINTLSGYTLEEQHRVICTVMGKVGSAFGDQTALAVLESNRIDPLREIDDFEAQLLGLSVRRRVANAEPLPF